MPLGQCQMVINNVKKHEAWSITRVVLRKLILREPRHYDALHAILDKGAVKQRTAISDLFGPEGGLSSIINDEAADSDDGEAVDHAARAETQKLDCALGLVQDMMLDPGFPGPILRYIGENLKEATIGTRLQISYAPFQKKLLHALDEDRTDDVCHAHALLVTD